jgi:hypothetical protein
VTICSSIFIGLFRESHAIIHVNANENDTWVSLWIVEQYKSEQKYSSWLHILGKWIDLSGQMDSMGLRPWVWSHACISINVETRQLVVVMNGIELFNFSVGTEFVNKKPRDLRDKLLFGDIVILGRAWQSESLVSNVNVYGDQLSIPEIIKITQGGNCNASGDYLPWNTMVFRLEGNSQRVEDKDQICDTKEHQLYLFTESFNWDSCVYLCQKINRGRVPQIANMTVLQTLIKWTYSIIVSEDIWLPFSDLIQENDWVDFYTGDSMNTDLLGEGQPNSGMNANCAGIWYGAVSDESCVTATPISCVCSFPKIPILILRGLCSKSHLDTHYTLYQGDLLSFYGIERTKIEYNALDLTWNSKVFRKTLSAKIEVETGFSMLLGTHLWSVSNDSISCKDGKTYSKYLKLSGCSDGEFTCNDGQCIRMVERCDQLEDCEIGL